MCIPNSLFMSFQFLENTKKRATTHPSTATTQVPQKFRYIASTVLCACEPLLSALEKLLQMTLHGSGHKHNSIGQFACIN